MTAPSAASRNAFTLETMGPVAVVTFDVPGAPVNTLSAAVRKEIGELLVRLESDAAVKAIVLISGKPDVFIAGADIEELQAARSAEDVERLSLEGQLMLDRLERGKPVVAAIDGACLGGGLEIALACAWRICTDAPKTILALPEVQLGLIPGAGGTQRLPRTVGLRSALDMILTGKNVRAKKALQIGLVDEMVHPMILRRVAIERATAFAQGKGPKHAKAAGGVPAKLLDETPFGRAVVFRQAREQTVRKTRGQYPAPLAALDAIAAGYQDRSKGYAEEARLFGEMAMTEVSQELIYLFFATTALKKDTGLELARGQDAPTPLPVAKIGVLGAGFMGAGIASVAVQQGTMVRLKDADHQRVGRGLAAVREVLKERLTRKQLTRQQFDDQLSLASGTVDYTGFAAADMVIEAVFEDLGVKHQVLRETERVTPEHAIFATNTSTIPITEIARAAARPDRVIGMHFFSPVHKMPLLEVIVTPRTSAEVTATTVAFGKKLGKTVIVVNDGPGFYANRILTPYINEAGALLDEGVAIDAVDRALVEFGFPVGPITLLDEVGLDIAAKSGRIVAEAFGARMEPSQSLQRVIAAGRLGRKGKLGFYSYDEDGEKGAVDATVYDLLPTMDRRTEVPADDLRRRCVLAMVNEAARCLDEGILRSARDGDIGAVFGIGFPPFRGGPFRYADRVGVAEVVRQLQELDARFPGRFAPAELLVEMAESGERFHPR